MIPTILLTLFLAAAPPVQSAGSAEESALVQEEVAECARLARRGQAPTALRRLSELLAERPAEVPALLARARVRLAQADLPGALADAEAAQATADAAHGTGPSDAALAAAARRLWAEAALVQGRAEPALERIAPLAPQDDPRTAWLAGRANLEAGRRPASRAAFEAGAKAAGPDAGWESALARARCQRALGDLEGASKSLVDAIEAAGSGAAAEGAEPDVLAELGGLYFEADREVARARRRSAAELYEQALELDATHEASLLGLFAVHRTNWQRQRRSAGELLRSALSARPDSVEALLVAAGADLDDGNLKSARERLARLEVLAGARRDVRALAAAVRWIGGEVEAADALLAALTSSDPADSAPEREAGRHLLELYRFAEGKPLLQRAVERDPGDHRAWTELGRALANCGEEAAALEALDRAEKESAGRQDAWRDNLRLVLRRIAERHGVRRSGELSFSWESQGDELLAEYMVPFYVDARTELSRRYGFTPGPTHIEVFRKHKDFSVRSTGFEGFPALGVCFGPVVTAVSPLAEMRGTQSWARTAFHEFTHVVHLGLSHNRCPRWITEGLATWEEVNANPSWTRNLRRELIDALANGDLLRARTMNAAFRGPRILFGYYQCGLICQMLIERHGFPAMVRLLAAFDRGADLDHALAEACGTTPEQLDQDFEAWARAHVAGLAVEPRWSPERLSRIALAAPAAPPAPTDKRASWAEARTTLAAGHMQAGRKVDAQQVLRGLRESGLEPARASLVRAEIELAAGEVEKAKALYRAAIAGGAEDYRARMALASIARDAGELDEALAELTAAERAFPGWNDPDLSSELQQAELYDELDRGDEAMAARERWLAWNAGDQERRRAVAFWHLEAGRSERALELYAQANEVDPFLRELHWEWGDALAAAKRDEEALREYRAVLLVPPELDVENSEGWSAERRGAVLALQAACLERLGRRDEAAAKAREALALDAASDLAREVLDKIQ